ncbi:hypothetical protein DRN97_11665 [Methanosarcinales archaeon]|nr:MAG: hypothetical protein DRN97_11665 [Methanosarcinales archaeon]
MEGFILLKIDGIGETIEEAVKNAIGKLKVKPKDEEYTVSVVQEPKRGFFGIGKREAKVEVSLTPRFIERRIEEVLRSIFEKAGWQVDFTVKSDRRSTKISVNGSKQLEDVERGLFRDLEYILTIHANRFTSTRYSVRFQLPKLDRQREKELQEMAHKIAQKILKSRRRFTFEPMSAAERRIVHETIKKFSELRSYSVGREPDRRVVVEFAKERQSKKKRKN